MSNASNLSALANVLDNGTSGQVLTSQGSGVLAFADAASGVTTYADTDSLPESGNSAGDLAYVTANTSLYHHNGTDWYGVELSLFSASTAAWYGDRGLTAGFSTSDDRIDYYDITTAGNASDFGNMSSGGYGNNGMASNGTRAVFGGVGWVGGMGNPTTIDYYTTATPSNSTDFGDLTVGRNCVALSNGTYAVFAGGGSTINTIDYITIASAGNATDFGNMSSGGYGNNGMASNGTRAVFGGVGWVGGMGNPTTIDYYTTATPSNSTDFGDLTVGRNCVALSNGTYAVFAGGGSTINTIDYITIASAGNATDFGDTLANLHSSSALSDATRGVIGGGFSGGLINVLQYVTVDTPSNATDFGDLLAVNMDCGACSDTTRGLFCGGNNTNVLQYITIQSAGNATDFGNLTVVTKNSAACSNGTRAVISLSMVDYDTASNRMDFVTIQTLGNASDFGDLTTTTTVPLASTSGAAS